MKRPQCAWEKPPLFLIALLAPADKHVDDRTIHSKARQYGIPKD
jgi:hypothetical protein